MPTSLQLCALALATVLCAGLSGPARAGTELCEQRCGAGEWYEYDPLSGVYGLPAYGGDGLKLCVVAEAYTTFSELQLTGYSDVEICGGADAPVPFPAVVLDVEQDLRLLLSHVHLRPTDDEQSGIRPRMAGPHRVEMTLESVVWNETAAPLIGAIENEPQSMYDLTVGGVELGDSAHLARVCSGDVIVRLEGASGTGEPFDLGSRNASLLIPHGGPDCTDDPTLLVTGRVRGAPSGQASSLAGEASGGERFETVRVEDFEAEGVSCLPACFQASADLSVRNVSLFSDGDASFTWFQTHGRVRFLDSIFRGQPKLTLAESNGGVAALRLRACSFGDLEQAQPLFRVRGNSSSVVLYNTAIRSPDRDLVEFDLPDSAALALRGVTWFVGGTQATPPSDLRMTNTAVVVGPEADSLEAVLGEAGAAISADDVVVIAAEDAFASGDGLVDCQGSPALAGGPVRDAGTTTTAWGGAGDTESLDVIAQVEISDLIGMLGELASGIDEMWMDPDGSGPDVGAYSGPLSDPELEPVGEANTDPDTGGVDTGVAGDQDAETSLSGWVYGVGCASRAGAPIGCTWLVVLAAFARRRRGWTRPR